MFTIDSDKTINVTRGDILYFGVGAEDVDTKEKYTFQSGDIVRMSVYGKKDCENVLMQKDFLVDTPTEEVEIFLEENDTKIGETISKPRDYWYEIVLNPDVKPQTIIGYDDDGAKVIRLYPEGEEIPSEAEEILPEDIPVVDGEFDALSDRPISNKAVTRAIMALNDEFNGLRAELERIKALAEGVTS